ncbi:MAG: hypothetical protein WCC64_09950 [Aliidongia sp.]
MMIDPALLAAIAGPDTSRFAAAMAPDPTVTAFCADMQRFAAAMPDFAAIARMFPPMPTLPEPVTIKGPWPVRHSGAPVVIAIEIV